MYEVSLIAAPQDLQTFAMEIYKVRWLHKGRYVQIVWKKFLRYFGVEPRIVLLKPGNYRLTAERLDK
jgi:hypothetical protein